MINSAPILQMTGIHKAFAAVKALDNVDFRLRPGEVHALLGENGAGKSTLLKVLTGAQQIDEGRIELRGEPVLFRSPLEAQHAGVSAVYQEVNLCPNLSVAENIYIGREPRRRGRIQWRAVRSNAAEALARVDVHVDVSALLSTHSLAVQQMVAIARAIDISADVLILDEPTSSLDQGEVDQLFAVIRQLTSQGIAVVFVSHFLDQVYEIADRMTVLRNGRLVGEWANAELTRVELVSKMLGREVKTLEALERTPRTALDSLEAATPVLETKGLGRKKAIAPFDLALHRGEVVGLAGLLGSGRTEVARLLFGADRSDSGHLFFEGKAGDDPESTDGDGEGRRVLPREPQDRGARRGSHGQGEHHPRASGFARLDAAHPAQAAGRARRPLDPRARHQDRECRAARADAERRQPAEGPPRPLADHAAEAADPRRADERHRRGREDGDSAPRGLAVRRRLVGPVHLGRDRGGASAEPQGRSPARPARRGGARQRRRRHDRRPRAHHRRRSPAA